MAGGFWDDGFNDFDPDNNDHNTAIAINGAVALAGVNGDDNTANTALSAGSNAFAAAASRDDDNDGNFALAHGVNAAAQTGGFRDNNDGNVAVAIGQNSGAIAGVGCAAVCSGGNNTGNAAFAWGAGARAAAGLNGDDHDKNIALAIGTAADAGRPHVQGALTTTTTPRRPLALIGGVGSRWQCWVAT